MKYHFHPPFFLSDPHPSFADAWEVFCCHLLNLEHGTSAIRRREPPEQGIDLIWHTEGLAYQCKSVEHERGKFKLDKAKASLQTALENQAHIGWKKYSICTNVGITGTQEAALRLLLPDIDFYDYTRWQHLCERFHEHIANYFGIFIPIVPDYVTNEVKKINQRFTRDFLPRFHAQEHLINILVGVHKYKNAFDLQVPATFTGQELLLLLNELLELPDPITRSAFGEAVYVTHYLCLGEQEIPLRQKLGDLQVGNRPVFTVLRITARSSAKGTEASGLFEGATRKPTVQSRPRPGTLEALVVEQYGQKMEIALDEAVNRFRQN